MIEKNAHQKVGVKCGKHVNKYRKYKYFAIYNVRVASLR